jgi:hypothetical protein
MGKHERQDHQPEPWAQHGREILDATGWTLGSARFPADARRIVAAINAVQGIPTDALESWFVNVIGETPGALVAAGDQEPSSASEIFPGDRRSSDRRRGDRRAERSRLSIFDHLSHRGGQDEGEGG